MLKIKMPSVSLVDILTVLFSGFCVLELNSDSYKYICLALLVCWVVAAFLNDERALIKTFNNKIILLLFLYVVIYFLYVSLTRDVVNGLKYAFTLVISESPFLLFLYYNERNTKNDSYSILPWLEFIVLLFLCVNILKLIVIDPNAARKMAANTNIYQDYVTGGGYQTAYTLCLLVPFLIFTYKNYRHKILVLLFIIPFAYTLVKCSYTIAILLAVFELFLLFYWRNEGPQQRKVGLVLLFVLAIGAFYLLREPIGNLFIDDISQMFSGTFVQRRMVEFGQFIKGEMEGTNGAATRMELYGISINTFFKSPIIGISYKTKFMAALEENLNGVRNLGIHSTIFDGFARIGISYIIYVIYYWKSINYIKKQTGIEAIAIVGVVFFLIKILNVADAFGVAYIAYFAIPMLCKHIYGKQESPEAIHESSK